MTDSPVFGKLDLVEELYEAVPYSSDFDPDAPNEGPEDAEVPMSEKGAQFDIYERAELIMVKRVVGGASLDEIKAAGLGYVDTDPDPSPKPGARRLLSMPLAGGDSSDHVLLMSDEFKVSNTNAVEDAAEMIEVVLPGLGSDLGLDIKSAVNSLPGESVSEDELALPTDTSVATVRVDVPGPQEAGAEAGVKDGRWSFDSPTVDGFLATTADGTRVEVPTPLALVVPSTKSESRIGDLPLALLDVALPSGELALLRDGKSIAMTAETRVVEATEFLGKDGLPATINDANGRELLTLASKGIAGDAPSLVVSRAPSSGTADLLAGIDSTFHETDYTTSFSRGDAIRHEGKALGYVDTDPDPSPKRGARRLRRYWQRGAGALKIRWNTPGDFRRCVRQLRKYVGPGAEGLCAVYHKGATGVWPGDKRNTGKSAMIADIETKNLVVESDMLRLENLFLSKSLFEGWERVESKGAAYDVGYNVLTEKWEAHDAKNFSNVLATADEEAILYKTLNALSQEN